METGSTATASATTQSCVCEDFLIATENAAIGGFVIRVAVSTETIAGRSAILAALSLGRRIPFPGKTETGQRETGSNVAIRCGQTEHAVLVRPFGREIAKTRDTHSIG